MSGKKGGGKLPAGMSVGEAATLWMEEKKGGWKESTYATYRSITEKHIPVSYTHLSLNLKHEEPLLHILPYVNHRFFSKQNIKHPLL